MVAVLPLRRKFIAWIFAALSAFVALTACDVPFPSGGPINTSRAVPVALLVPKSSANGGCLAQSLENAARLAVNDLDRVAIDLKVYDTAGTPAGAHGRCRARTWRWRPHLPWSALRRSRERRRTGRGAARRERADFLQQPVDCGRQCLHPRQHLPDLGRPAGALCRVAGARATSMSSMPTDPAEQLGAACDPPRHRRPTGRTTGRYHLVPAVAAGRDRHHPLHCARVPLFRRIFVFVTSGTAGALPFLAELLARKRDQPGQRPVHRTCSGLTSRLQRPVAERPARRLVRHTFTRAGSGPVQRALSGGLRHHASPGCGACL